MQQQFTWNGSFDWNKVIRWIAEIEWAAKRHGRKIAKLSALFVALGISSAASAAPVLAAERPVHTEPGDLPRLKVARDGKTLELPLEHTHVKASITGYVARVEVTQRYKNPYPQPIEAVYVFPLPENSAVDDMKMVIGTRVIQAEIQKRADARRTYDSAKQQGHTAALLEQERPNVFTQSVANIAPGVAIEVVVQYLQDLTYDAGEYEFVFPMVVGPRFSPEGAVPDAARISPPILGAGMRSGHDISLELHARAGLAIKRWEAPTHDVKVTPTLDGTLKLEIARKDSLPNRDFVLRYSVDGQEPEASVLGERDGKGGFLTLIVQPPALDVDKLVGNREIIFVVDVSGSMWGVPLAMCKDAMREALRQLRPVDTFNIYSFSGYTGSAFAEARAANDANIKDGLDYVHKLQAGGGTYMADAVKAALSGDVAPGRNRYVFFMTDGYVGNEAQILAQTEAFVKSHKARGKRAKVFGFGVGSSVNRYLLDGFGKAGEGLTVYATTREDPALAVNKFYRYIDSSILEDVKVDWNGLAVSEVYPAQLPDLFASHPLTVHARYAEASTAGGKHKIFIRAKRNGRELSLPVEVELSREKKEKTALATLWARSKITDLERDLWSSEDPKTVDAITELGIEHRIVTKYTSFVAVDRSSKVDGTSRTIMQPVQAPEGVDANMAGAGQVMGYASTSKPMPAAPPAKEYAKHVRGFGWGESHGMGGLGLVGRKASSPSPSLALDDRQPASEKKAREAADEPAAPTPAVLAALDGHKRELSALAEKYLGKGKTTVVSVRFFITPEGKIIQAKVISAQGSSKDFEKALLALLTSWTLPAPKQGAAAVTHTFRFPG